MNPKRLRATFYGALAGVVVAVGMLALFGGLFGMGSVKPVVLDNETLRARPVFEVTTGALYFAYVVASLLGGLLIAGVAYAFGRESEPDSPRFPLRYLLPAAAVTAAVFAYAVLRAGLAAAGDISHGIATISVFRMVLTALLSGAVAGGITAGTVDTLARPAVLGLEGEAWPSSPAALMREMGRAVGIPAVALLSAAAFAILLSQVLLAIEGTAAIALFSVVGALVLGGATLLALRPWEKNGSSGSA